MIFEDAFFDTNDYELTDKKLGEGAFGKVYIVQNNNDGTEFAAKIIDTKGLFNGHDQMMLMRESMILHELDHPSIVKFYGINFHSFFDSTKLEPTILTEYLPNGSLKEILDKEKKSIADGNWTPTKKYICLLGISDAMKYLHSKGILHRDLKPQNILIDADFYPRVCDFGLSKCFSFSLSRSIQLIMTGKIGTPLYMAPELFEDDDKYGPGVDVYAFGIMAYEIVTGKEPFSENGKSLTLKNLMLKVMSGSRPSFPDGISDKMKDLISSCWSQDPKERPSFEEIFQLLSTDFSYFDESVDEDEIIEYLENLEEQRCKPSKISPNLSKVTEKIEEEKKALQEKVDQLNDKLNTINESNDDLILAFNSIHGRVIEYNPIQAISYLKKSSEKGNCCASYLLGLLHENGELGKQNFEEAKKYYESSSQQGTSQGLNRIGLCYSDGYGVEEDKNKAHEFYQKSANLGNLYSIINLAAEYAEGKVVKQDINKALKLAQQAADQGFALGFYFIGTLYYKGLGVTQNYSTAFEFFNKAAKLDLSAAFYSIAHLYNEGKGVKQDSSKAIEYFMKASEMGCPNASLDLANIYDDKEYFTKALEYFQKAADCNNSEALYFRYKFVQYFQKAENLRNNECFYNLGNLYYNGFGVKKDYEKALLYYQKANNYGNVRCLVSIGNIFYDGGYGVKQDYSKALENYLLAAKYNISMAFHNIGVIYYYGKGVKKDYSKALEYYQIAVSLGDSTPFFNMAIIYYYGGYGVKQDYSKALEYFKKASDNNDLNANNYLGDIYYYGRGVKIDLYEAFQYYNKASK